MPEKTIIGSFTLTCKIDDGHVFASPVDVSVNQIKSVLKECQFIRWRFISWEWGSVDTCKEATVLASDYDSNDALELAWIR